MHITTRLTAIVLAASPAISWADTADAPAPAPAPALTAAQQATAAAELAESKLREAKANAEISKIKTEAVTASIPNLTADIKGETKVGDKAGKLEAALLSAQSTDQAAAILVSRIRADVGPANPVMAPAIPAVRSSAADTASGQQSAAKTVTGCSIPDAPAGGLVRKLYIYTEADRPVFDAADAVSAQFCALQEQLDKAVKHSNEQKPQVAPHLAPALALPAIAAAVTAVAALFKTDFEIQGIELTPDDLLLAKLVAAEAHRKLPWPTFIPALYGAPVLTEDNPIQQRLKAVRSSRNEADARIKSHIDEAKRLTAAAKGKPNPAAAEQTKVATELEAAVKAYDDAFVKLTTASDKGIAPIAEAARQAAIRRDLANGAYLLIVKANATGGSYTITKNILTTLDIHTPFRVSGGAVVSYTLIDGRDGQVASGGQISVAGGYKSLGDVHAAPSGTR